MSITDIEAPVAPQPRAAVSVSGRPYELMSAVRGLGRELWSDPVSFVGFVILLSLVLTAIFAPLIAPYDPATQLLRARLLPPFWLPRGSMAHLLGTDYLGRDVLSRLIHGSRASLGIGASVVALAGSFGVVMGLVAGYAGGRTDNIIMRAIDTQIAFPGLLLALIILATIGPTTATVIVVLALNGWMVYARMTRGIVLSLKQMPFVEAAEIIGCRPGRVVFRHLLPNLTSPLLTLIMLEFARVVLAEASLSFLGLGVQPPASSWGLDVATGKAYIFNAWWLVTFPGFAIALTVLAINLLASWARVTTDPQEREKRFARLIRARLGGLVQRLPLATASQPVATNLLTVRDLVVHFHTRSGTVQAVRGLDLKVRRGETVGIVGESGSGKSVSAQAVMGLVNVPGVIAAGTDCNNYIDTRNEVHRTDQGTARVDHVFANGDAVYARYSLSGENGFMPINLPGFGTYHDNFSQQGNVAWNRIVSPRMVNVATLSVSRLAMSHTTESANTNDIVSQLGIQGIGFGGPGAWGAPWFNVQGYSGMGDTYAATPMKAWDTIIEGRDVLSWQRGRHGLKFGGSYRRYIWPMWGFFQNRGYYQFTNGFTTHTATNDGTGSGLASFLLGLPAVKQVQAGIPQMQLRQWAADWFAQDTFQLTRNTTVEFGLRYEFMNPLVDIRYTNSNLTFVDGTPEAFIGGQNGYPQGLLYSQKKNFAPRFGMIIHSP